MSTPSAPPTPRETPLPAASPEAAADRAADEPRLSAALAWVLATAGLAAVATLYVLGTRGFPLSEPDEARYAEIAREMLVRGDWITPHLNFVKYFEKPPLVYWATALAYVGFGISEFTARLPVVVSGLATLVLTVGLAARMYGATTALLTLPILALGPLFAILAQALTLDMPLTACMTLAMVALWLGWSRQHAAATDAFGDGASGLVAASAPRAWYRVTYVATALAILVKGFVAAILVGGATLLFLVLHGGWRAVRPALDWRGMALALGVALPWFVLVSWRNPEFFRFFVIDQQVARYLWTHEHDQPIWFFLPAIPAALAPWGVMLLFDPVPLRAALAPRTWSVATRFLVIWAAVVVGFFSVSTSKLLTYILPALPPLAILVARATDRALARGRTAGLSRLGWFFLVAGPIMSLCGVVLPRVLGHWRTPLLAPYLFIGGPLLVATGWLVRRRVQRARPYAAAATLAVGWFVVLAVAITGRGVANDYRSLGLAARAAMGPDDRIAMYNHVVDGIPLYAQRRVIMVGSVGELRFGSRVDDGSAYFWPDDEALRREWAGPGRLFLVINRSELDAITPPLSPPPIVLAAKDKKVLVVNR